MSDRKSQIGQNRHFVIESKGLITDEDMKSRVINNNDLLKTVTTFNSLAALEKIREIEVDINNSYTYAQESKK